MNNEKEKASESSGYESSDAFIIDYIIEDRYST